MLGAIAGDIIGSAHEAAGTKTTEFPLFDEYARFTDDTVLTVAVAESLLTGTDLVDTLHEYFDRYPQAGYGGSFIGWALRREREPYGSWGNGSAMRVSPVAYAYEALEEVLCHAERTAAVTHNHPEGIKGAQATAAAVFLARTGSDKDDIKQFVEDRFGYDLSKPLRAIRPATCSTSRVRGRCPSRWWRSWRRRISRRPCGMRSRWAAMPTRWPVLRGPSRKRISASQRRSSGKPSPI